MTITTTPIIPENGRPLARFDLQVGQAIIWAEHTSCHDDATVTTLPVTITRFTSHFLILRLESGREMRRKRRTSYTLFFRGWCPICELPACTDTANPRAMVCGSCGVVCEGLPPAHVFPATVRDDDVKTARRYRLMAERGWTIKQAWDRVHGPLRLPPLDLPPFTDELTANQFGDFVLELRRRQQAEIAAALQQPLPPVSPFDQVPQGDADLFPSRSVSIPIARSPEDCEPDGDDDLTRWLARQFRRAA